MPISHIYFLDLQGRPLLCRTYRDDIGTGRGLEAAESFLSTLREAKHQILARSGSIPKPLLSKRDLSGSENDNLSSFLPPVLRWKGITHIYQRHNNIYILLLSIDDELDCLSFIVFIEKLILLMEEYFTALEEETIRDNFVIIYQLLDEVIDFGYPQQTEPSILKEFIGNGGYYNSIFSFLGGEKVISTDDVSAVQPPLSINSSSKITWRREGISYPSNQVFLDVIERINVVITAVGMKTKNGDGTGYGSTSISHKTIQQPIGISLVNGEIQGTLRMKSLLSGMPELRLGLNDKSIFESLFGSSPSPSNEKKVNLDNVKFHQCVRLAKFEDDRSISFCPPDGEFDLMTYSQKIQPGSQPIIWVVPRITKWSNSLFEISLEMHNNLPPNVLANGIEVHIPTPKDCDSPKFKCDVGFANYCPERDIFIWTVGLITKGKEFSMHASFGLSSIKEDCDDVTLGGANGAGAESLKRLGAISLFFEVPYYTSSGLIIKFLKIQENAGYVAQPWVRYISESGDYHIRGAEADE